MTRQVTDEDMARFAALGYPAQVRASSELDATSLVESLRHVLESPSARLLKAAALSVRWLANHDALDLVQEVYLSPEATRRLGFVAEKLAQKNSLDDAARHRLRGFAADLHEPSMTEGSALTFSAAVTDTYLEKLRGETDETSQRWQVFAELD